MLHRHVTEQVVTARHAKRLWHHHKHMPIEKSEFERLPAEALELKADSQPYEVLMFLVENAEHAFTTSEIADETNIETSSARTVLHRLGERGLVVHKGRYWTAAEDDRLASYGAQKAQSSASAEEEYYG